MGNQSINSLKYREHILQEKQAQAQNNFQNKIQSQFLNQSSNNQQTENSLNSSQINQNTTNLLQQPSTPNLNENKKHLNIQKIQQKKHAQKVLSQFAPKSIFSQYKQNNNNNNNTNNTQNQINCKNQQNSCDNSQNNNIDNKNMMGSSKKSVNKNINIGFRSLEDIQNDQDDHKLILQQNLQRYRQIVSNKEIRTPRVQNQKLQSIIDRIELTKETNIRSKFQTYLQIKPIKQQSSKVITESMSPQKQINKLQNQQLSESSESLRKQAILKQANRKRTKSRFFQTLYEQDQQRKQNEEEKNKKIQPNPKNKKAKIIKDNLKSFDTPSFSLAPIKVQQSSQVQYQQHDKHQYQKQQDPQQQQQLILNQNQQIQLQQNKTSQLYLEQPKTPKKNPPFIELQKILNINFNSPIENRNLRHRDNKDENKSFLNRQQSQEVEQEVPNFSPSQSQDHNQSEKINVQNSPEYKDQLYQMNLHKALQEEDEEENQSDNTLRTSTFNSKSLNSLYKNTFDSHEKTNSDPSSNLTSSMKRMKLFNSEGTKYTSNSQLSKQCGKFKLRRNHSDDFKWYRQQKYYEKKQLNQVIKEIINHQSFSHEKNYSDKKNSSQTKKYDNKQTHKFQGSKKKANNKKLLEFKINTNYNKKKLSKKPESQQNEKDDKFEFKRQKSNYLNILKFDDQKLQKIGIQNQNSTSSEIGTPNMPNQLQKTKSHNHKNNHFFFEEIQYNHSSQDQQLLNLQENSIIQEEDEEDQENENAKSICDKQQVQFNEQNVEQSKKFSIKNQNQIKQIEKQDYNINIEDNENVMDSQLSSTRNFKSLVPKMSTTFKIRAGIIQISMLTGQKIKNTLQIFTQYPNADYLTTSEINDILSILQIQEREGLIEILVQNQIERMLIDDLIKIYELDQINNQLKDQNSQININPLKSPNSNIYNQEQQQIDQSTLYFKDQLNNEQAEDIENSPYTQSENLNQLQEQQILDIKNWLDHFDQKTNENPKNSEKLYIIEILPEIVENFNIYIKEKKEKQQIQYNHCFLSDSNIKTIDFNPQLIKEQLKKKIFSQTPNYPSQDQIVSQDENYLRSYQLQVRSSPINIQSNMLANSPCLNPEQYIKRQGQYVNQQDDADDIVLDNNTIQQTPNSTQFFHDNKIVLLEDIKKGGQGDIKSGFCLETKQILAIKTFKNEWDFRNEVMLYEFVIQQKLDYLFLRLISKDSNPPYKLIMERGACDLKQYILLRTKIDKKPLKREEVLFIFFWLAQACEQLINAGIYFSDMKPDNILLQYNREDHSILDLYLVDLGGAYNDNDKNDDFQYPNCITKFYFPLEFISNEIVNKRRNITQEEMAQCEMYQIARTIQVCLNPNYKSENIQKKNFNLFSEEFSGYLGSGLLEILRKCLDFDKIIDPFKSLTQLRETLQNVINQQFNQGFQYYIVNQSNNIKDWQDRLVKEKQDWSNVDLKELKQQAIFYEKIKLYRNQENVLKEISKRLTKQYNETNSNKEKTKILNYKVKNLIDLGKNFQNQGKYDNSLDYYIQAKKISEKLSKQKNVHQGDCLNLIGGILQKKGKMTEALLHFREALEHFNGFFNGEDKSIQQADVYVNIGQIYISMGDIENALAFYKKALNIKLSIYEDIYDPDLASLYLGFGVCQENLEKFEFACENYELCLDIYEKNNLTNTIGYADALNNMGNIHYQQQNLQQAFKLFKKSLKIQQQLLGINHINTALTLRNIGVIQKQFENYDKALELFQKALQIKKEHYKTQPHHTIADTQIQIASTLLVMNEIEQALDNLTEAHKMRIRCFGEKHPLTKDALMFKTEVSEVLEKVNNMMSSSGRDINNISTRYSSNKNNSNSINHNNLSNLKNNSSNSNNYNSNFCQNSNLNNSNSSINQNLQNTINNNNSNNKNRKSLNPSHSFSENKNSNFTFNFQDPNSNATTINNFNLNFCTSNINNNKNKHFSSKLHNINVSNFNNIDNLNSKLEPTFQEEMEEIEQYDSSSLSETDEDIDKQMNQKFSDFKCVENQSQNQNNSSQEFSRSQNSDANQQKESEKIQQQKLQQQQEQDDSEQAIIKQIEQVNEKFLHIEGMAQTLN